MALTLQQIRDYIRLHLDLEVEDLPDALIDVWVRDASKRVERAEVRWPFYEVTHSLTQATGVDSVLKTAIHPLLDQVTAIEHTDSTHWPPLRWIGFDAFNDERSTRPASSGRPVYFSDWAEKVFFFPTPDLDYTFNVHGYRHADDWVAAGAGATPDMADDLHNAVATFALSKAYSQQEDDALASLYERQFADELNEYRRRLSITPYNQPLVLNGGATPSQHGRHLRPFFDFEVH